MTTVLLKKDLMTDEEFSLLRDLIHREFGILLRGDKRLTLHTKVAHRLRVLGLRDYGEYYEFIKSDSSGEELYELASHITNNETYFFREKGQLALFSDLLKEIRAERQRMNEQKLRILSLASSSGEEAYSLNIIIQESGYFVWNWDIKITGMDINRRVLTKAREAAFTKNSFRGLNGDGRFVEKYFSVQAGKYVLRRSLTKNVEFVRGNIVDSRAYDGLEPMDVIFCRNVLIYMSDEAIARLAANFYSALSEKGYLFIGSSESLIQKTNLFVPEYRQGAIVYRKNTDIEPIAEESERGEKGKEDS